VGLQAQEPIAADNGTIEEVGAALVSPRSRPTQLEAPDSRAADRSRRWAARDPLRRRILALADLCTVAAVGATLALFGPGLSAALGALLLVPGFILAAKLCGLYDRDHRALRHLTVDELPYLLIWAIVSIGGLALWLELTSLGQLDAATAIRALVVALAAALLFRVAARFAWRRVTPPERVVIVGRDELTRSIRRKLELFSDTHATVVAAYPTITPALLGNGRLAPGVDRLVLAAQSIDERVIADVVAACRRSQVKLSVVPATRGVFGTAVQLHHIAELPVVEYNTWDVSRSTLLLKRVLDVAAATLLLLLTAPLVLAIVVAARLAGDGPAFFVQSRAGLGGQEFRMYKFRTMRPDAESLLPAFVRLDRLDEPMFKLAHDPRVTRLGRFLRRWSLDELPQLLNVVKGEMSLVGPRPEQVELVKRYRPEHRFRLAVKPGLTGPMQVFGRGALRFEERLAVERDYIENLSLSRDLRILALTVPSVLCGRGAY
jgi:exopolysaccharide biosynthesis polyprenyl glycosylphosphotransferase